MPLPLHSTPLDVYCAEWQVNAIYGVNMARYKNKNPRNRYNSIRNGDTRVTNVNSVHRTRFPRYIHQPDLFEDLNDLQSLSEIEDRRFNRPIIADATVGTFRGKADIIPNPFQPFQVPPFLAFKAPDNVVTCVRRKVRKKMMFVFNKAGKAGQRKPRRNFNSDVRC